jgi:CheY-like chemotaxis protein
MPVIKNPADRVESPADTRTIALSGDPSRWQDLVAELGAEISAPLTSALERIHSLITSGRIERASLRALREEVEQARRVGMIGQQLTRFASGRLRQSPERLQLADMLKGVLTHRTRETQARGVLLKPALKPAEVIVDASLLFGLLNTLLDWALANARSHIEFVIDVKSWPPRAQLNCQFTHCAPDSSADDAPAPPPSGSFDSLTWRLLEQTAWAMGLPLERKRDTNDTTLTLEFPRTVNDAVEAVSAVEIDDGFAPSTNSKPLAGSHVLVVSSRRDLRVQIRDALRNMGLIVDFVNSVDEAADFCREGLPHAIVIESIQGGERFSQLRDEISAEVPDFAFIEIIEEGNTFEMSGFSGSNMARVGRDLIASSLPSALMFELSKGH